MAYKVAVVGATGNVGREMLNVLVQRQLGGEGGPGLVGTVDNGAAKLELRWHPGE